MMNICSINAGQLFQGLDFPIYGVSPQYAPENNSIIFVKNKLSNYEYLKDAIVVTKEPYSLEPSNYMIVTEAHKTEYGKLINKLYNLLPEVQEKEENGSIIAADLIRGSNVYIERNCHIGRGVTIGNNVKIGFGSYIGNFVQIGDYVDIRENCKIGIDGADIYWSDERCYTITGIGGISIESGCLLLAGSTIVSGNATSTVLKKNTIVGLNSMIGENSIVGNNTLIGSGSIICGNTDISDHVYIAPNCTVLNRLNIEKNSYIGIGSVVVKNIEENMRVQGNPARRIPV